MSPWQVKCATRNVWTLHDLHHWKLYNKSIVVVDLHSCIKMHYLTSYHVLVVEFGDLPWNYMRFFDIVSQH